MTFGEKIANIRQNKNISINALANLLNINDEEVRNWESDKIVPNLETIVKISNAMNVSLDYLLKDIDFQNPDNEMKSKQKETKSIKTLNPKKYLTIKIWEIIGCVLSPIAFCGSIFGLTNGHYLSYLGLLLYLINIPLCIISLKSCKKTNNLNKLIVTGILSLFFVSFIGGILILILKDDDFNTKFGSESQKVNVFSIEQNENSIKSESSKTKIENEIIKKEERLVKINFKDKAEKYYFNKKIDLKSLNKKNKVIFENRIKKIQEDLILVSSEEEYNKLIKDIDNLNNDIVKKKRINDIAKASLIILSIGCISLVITAPIIYFNNKQTQEKIYDYYIKLLNMVYNYNPSNGDVSDYNYEIEYLMSIVDGHYDLEDIYNEYTNASNYYLLKNEIANFVGESEQNDRITYLLNNISYDYKSALKIMSDFDYVKTYIPKITRDKSQFENLENMDEGISSSNRELINYLYITGNSSKLRNFDKYINKISLPYILFGAKCSNESFNFSWYQDDDGQKLSRYLPTPAQYSPNEDYYFEVSHSQTNELNFQLTLVSNTSQTVKLFSVKSFKWLIKNQFSCSVYLYGNGEVDNFTFEV